MNSDNNSIGVLSPKRRQNASKFKPREATLESFKEGFSLDELFFRCKMGVERGAQKGAAGHL